MFHTAMTSLLLGQPDVPITPPTEIYLAQSSAIVPDVADLSVADARALLNQLGLVVTGATSGTAGATSPAAGTRLRPDTRVTLYSYGGQA
jgi:beta-lactam-binding protein with PASTA domain